MITPETLLSSAAPAPVSPGEKIPRARGIADLSFLEFFQTASPVEIEIGCGKAKFLMTRARTHPEILFLGLDRIALWLKRRQVQAEKQELKNLKLIKAEARELLERHIPAGSVSAFHIYFPDPWPKRRHRRRRLVGEEFLRLLYERLLGGGKIHIATDDPDYFAHIKKAASVCRNLWSGWRENVNQRLEEGAVATNYEMKYQAQGRDIYYLELVR